MWERDGNRIPNARGTQSHRACCGKDSRTPRSNRAIGITEHVVKNYLLVIYDKLGLWNRVELDRGVLRTFFSPAYTFSRRSNLRLTPHDPGDIIRVITSLYSVP